MGKMHCSQHVEKLLFKRVWEGNDQRHSQCSDGSFEGYDSETGDQVYDGCSHGGELKAYDSETSAYVYGSCEGS